MNYNEYFDFIRFYEKDIIKFKCKLKDSFIDSKEGVPLREGGKLPYSSMELPYFLYYFDDTDVATKLYEFRKSIASKHKMADWFISNDNLSDYDIEKINDWKSSYKNKIQQSLKNNYDSDKAAETKKLYADRSKKHSKRIGQINKEKWKDKEWVDKIMNQKKNNGSYEKSSKSHIEKHQTDEKFRKDFLLRMKDSNRIEKIRNAAIQMWDDARNNDRQKFKRMLLSQKNKNFELNGFKMNQIEFMIASILNELKVKWEYESVFQIDNHTYLPDFYLKDYDLIIECYGDFWHANPKYMKPTDTTHKYIQASSVWKRDKRRIDELSTIVSNVLILWETDILENAQDCKQKINNIIYG